MADDPHQLPTIGNLKIDERHTVPLVLNGTLILPHTVPLNDAYDLWVTAITADPQGFDHVTRLAQLNLAAGEVTFYDLHASGAAKEKVSQINQVRTIHPIAYGKGPYNLIVEK